MNNIIVLRENLERYCRNRHSANCRFLDHRVTDRITFKRRTSDDRFIAVFTSPDVCWLLLPAFACCVKPRLKLI